MLQEETTAKEGDIESPLTIDYKEYKKVGNLMFPHAITQNVAGQEFTVIYTDIKWNEVIPDADFK